VVVLPFGLTIVEGNVVSAMGEVCFAPNALHRIIAKLGVPLPRGVEVETQVFAFSEEERMDSFLRHIRTWLSKAMVGDVVGWPERRERLSLFREDIETLLKSVVLLCIREPRACYTDVVRNALFALVAIY